jgi:hypothetical protein
MTRPSGTPQPSVLRTQGYPAFYHGNYARVVRYFRYRVGDQRELAYDLVAETLNSEYENREAFRGSSMPRVKSSGSKYVERLHVAQAAFGVDHLGPIRRTGPTYEILRAMSLPDGILLPGESILSTKRANAIVRPTDYGLGRFPFDKYMGLAGMRGREGVGGNLYLTAIRLIFRSHAFNRIGGTFSIFLSSIQQTLDTSELAVRKVRVATASQDYEFVMWGIPNFLALLTAQRSVAVKIDRAQLLQLIAEHPSAFGSDLSASRNVDLLVTGAASLLSTLEQVGHDGGLVSSLINFVDGFSE